MVSCLMGDSTALASAIVRCCLKVVSLKYKAHVINVTLGLDQSKNKMLYHDMVLPQE